MLITQAIPVIPRRLEDAPAGLENVTAAILAGGVGTRLRSAVPDRPKVLALVHGRPFIACLLDRLADAGIRQTVLLTGYRADEVQRALEDERAGMKLIHSTEPAPLGTGGALRHSLAKLSASVILLFNGDSWCDVDLAQFFSFHRRTAPDLTMVVTEADDSARYGTVEVEASGRVKRFDEKRDSTGAWINAGVYLLERDLIETIPAGVPMSLERDLLPHWLARNKVFAYRHRGRFLDIGTPESYAAAELLIPPPESRSQP